MDDKSITHIDTQQVGTGGLGSTELRALDWKFREHKDNIFGEVQAKSRWVKLEDVDDDEFLKTGWDDMKGEHVQAWAESEAKGWTANQVRWVPRASVLLGGWLCWFLMMGLFADEDECRFQVWGFEVLSGKRYYVRHIAVRKGDDWKLARLVYDYQK